MELLTKSKQQEQLDVCKKALVDLFPNGMKADDAINQHRLVARYNEIGGYRLDPNDNEAQKQLLSMAKKADIVCNGFVYAKGTTPMKKHPT